MTNLNQWLAENTSPDVQALNREPVLSSEPAKASFSDTSDLEGEFAQQVMLAGLPEPVREYRFAAEHVGLGRGVLKRLNEAGLQDWRFDFAWPDLLIAAEIEGGTWVYGRHNRPEGFERDCRKYNSAAILGWTVLRFTSGMVNSQEGIAMLIRLFDTQ